MITIMYVVDVPKVVGWERNEKNKLQPKMVNLSSSMDPVRYIHMYVYVLTFK